MSWHAWTREVPYFYGTQSPISHFGKKDDFNIRLNDVSFSGDGRYLTYSEDDKTITLWIVQDVLPELLVTLHDHTSR
ncbi:hypothetical protein K503DRAFT_446915 [Rhizopogon vinicolor AM-OR11-026]|uniref:WD40 repeat-like protein n=1 Tax=Rhizopogon vinicolor AM-OR11-026 TaxID=1314800 RepID=A0A1B7NHB9_9AGAM|nr:hypothetical protein K503DRAFT_446915 [Rhizopogon vinicolor AM-OR11-026]